MPSTMVEGIHTVIVQTADMDRAVSFFKEVLGLTPGYSSAYWSDFQLGSARLGIHPGFGEPPFAIAGKGAVIGISVTNIEEFRGQLESAGEFVRGEFHQTPSGVVLDFCDPDGNNFQAIELGKKL